MNFGLLRYIKQNFANYLVWIVLLLGFFALGNYTGSSQPVPETDWGPETAEVVREVEEIKSEEIVTEEAVVKEEEPVATPEILPVATVKSKEYYVMLKDVGEPFLENFGLSPADFNNIKAAGVDIIAGNFDICATPSEVLIFLTGAQSAGLKVIMSAGAGEAEWGYPCDENFSNTLKPEWQKEAVQAWVRKWAYHPAIFAWDISNEDGQNFPNAQNVNENWAEQGYALTVAQLQQAYRDVKQADPTRPTMIRMNGWYFYDYDSNFFRAGNAFGPNIADIVMVNAYSNVGEYFPDFVSTVSTRAYSAVRAMTPNAKIIVALGAWQEPPLWVTPSLENFKNDIAQAQKTNNLLGMAVFKYGAEESEWWMPRDALTLWNSLKDGVLKSN